MDEIFKMALSQGLWAVLFVWLLVYILKKQEQRDIKSEQRESSYQDIIGRLTEKLSVIDTVKTDVEEIKDILRK